MNPESWSDAALRRLERILDRVEALLGKGEPAPFDPAIFRDHLAFRWEPSGDSGRIVPVAHPHRVDLSLLVGIDGAKEELVRNTAQFVAGAAANHVLLWGERGTGKSSCVKGLLDVFGPKGLRIVELARWDLFSFPRIAGQLRGLPYRFILFCDDLSFDEEEVDFRGLKTLLDGGVEERPENVLIYATSNRRHLMPEQPGRAGGGGRAPSGGGRLGEAFPVRPVRPAARLLPVRPGHVPRHRRRIRAAAAPSRRPGDAAGGGAALGAFHRLAQRADGEAVHRRPRRPHPDAGTLTPK